MLNFPLLLTSLAQDYTFATVKAIILSRDRLIGEGAPLSENVGIKMLFIVIISYIVNGGRDAFHSLHLLVLNLAHTPLYRHFCKCLYIEMLIFSLVY